ncbi:MAG: class I SAM-dependent methyltransferase [Candidatus Saccharibacteria bacterium]|nr:class I SAM-dependent methyltransferase [Candidatus Saccharibacteria bacterium]
MNLFLVFLLILALLFGATVLIGAPYVPSKPSDLRRAFTKLYNLTEKDFLVDLGAGDGLVLKIAANEFGAEVLGVEINPILVLIIRWRMRKIPKARVLCENLFQARLPRQTTVVYTFGESRDIGKIYQKIEKEAKRLKKPLYFISYAFEVPGVKFTKKYGTHFLYEVGPK